MQTCRLQIENKRFYLKKCRIVSSCKSDNVHGERVWEPNTESYMPKQVRRSRIGPRIGIIMCMWNAVRTRANEYLQM